MLYDIPQTAITPLVADTAVRGDPRMIQWVPRELRTADLCLYAEAAHPELRVYVPDGDSEGTNIYSFHRQVDAKIAAAARIRTIQDPLLGRRGCV